MPAGDCAGALFADSTICLNEHKRAFRTGKIVVLTPHLVPPIRPDYFRLRTQNFESGLTPHLVPPIRPDYFWFPQEILKVG